MRFCHRYLKHHVGYNSWLGLPFFTIAEPFSQGRLSKRFALAYEYITELIQLLACISCALAAPLVWGNIDVLCGCLSSVTHSLQVVTKTAHLKIRRKPFLRHLNRLDGILAKNDLLKIPGYRFNFPDYFHEHSRYVRVAQMMHLAAQVFSTSIYFLPLLYCGVSGFEEGMHLPIVGYIPFDTSSQVGYLLSFLFQMTAFYLFNTKTVVIDYFILDIIVLHSTQIRFLNDVMEALITASDEGTVSQKEKEYYLKLWVRQHQRAISSNQSLQPLMSGYLIIEYLYAFVHTCMPAFVITSTNSWTVAQKTALLCMISSGLLALFLLAAAGDALNSVGRLIEKTMYGEWLASWKGMQTVFRMYSCLQRRPFYLTFASLFPLCFPTFLAISRLILTYYMTLNEIQTMKKEVQHG